MRLAFHEYCFQVWKMKQNPKFFSSESWFINTCITLLILFNITIAPQASFAEEDQMPQVAPHLIPGYRSYYAEDSIQLQDMAYQNQPSGSLPVSKKTILYSNTYSIGWECVCKMRNPPESRKKIFKRQDHFWRQSLSRLRLSEKLYQVWRPGKNSRNPSIQRFRTLIIQSIFKTPKVFLPFFRIPQFFFDSKYLISGLSTPKFSKNYP